MGYNLTIIERVTNIMDLSSGISSQANNGLFIGLLYCFFITFLLVFHKEDMKAIFLVDSFITFLIGSIFFIGGFIQFNSLIVFIIFIFIGLFINIFMNER